MKTGTDLAQQAARDIAASSTTSPTAAGRTERARTPQLVEAINQIFALFRLNYHNQYFAAFSDVEQLNQIKKLWADSLDGMPVEVLLAGAKRCIEQSQYLPTMHLMLEACRAERLGALGLPEVHAAYVEACLAPEPRQAHRWSHPAVYLAGRDSGWFFLASAPETKAFPVFERHYRALCDRIAAGEELALPALPPPETATRVAADPEQQREQLARLRAETGI